MKQHIAIQKTIFILSLYFLIGISLIGCNKNKRKNRGVLPDSSIYSAQNFTDFLLDSANITNYFKNTVVSDTVKNEVNQFYARRNYQFAWFNKNGITHAVSNFHSQLQGYSRDFSDNSLNSNELDTLISEIETDEKSFLSNKNRVLKLELLLTTTFFQYAQKAYSGTTKDPLDLEWFIPRKKKNYQVLLDSLVSLAKGEKIQEPVNQYYVRLKEQLIKYRNLEKKGGFPTITTHQKNLSIGNNDSCVLNLKQYLSLTGDLQKNDKSIVFTDSLRNALQYFQQRMGLVENGKLTERTLQELNCPIEVRIRQIMVNMERLRWIPVDMEQEYLLINIPEFRLHIFEQNKPINSIKVVVGSALTKTSIFKGNLSQIVLNPYWGVPTSIVRKEIVPKLKQNTSYLARNNMEVLSGNKVVNPASINWNSYDKNVPFEFRQKPGKNNALGKMKFLFPNNFHIYLHDTPSKSLFNESKRAFSHGCIRVENPKKLALYLLRNDANWNEQKVDKILKTDQETGIRVRPTVPVYIAYFTAWVDSKGQMNFRNDLYQLDDKLSKEIFGESVK